MSTEPDGPMGGGDKGVPLHPTSGPQGPWFPQPGFTPMTQGWIPPSQPWVPPTTQPWTPTSQSWGGPWGVPNYSQSTTPNVWSHPPATTTTMTTNASGNAVPDEYTVDTLRRIYDNDDGRIEIQRVKVHRRPAAADFRGLTYPGFDSVGGMSSPENMSLVSADSFPLNERRPPPRKNKKKKEGQMAQMQNQPQQGPYPWYPHMPYMPYPYPYCFGYMWPPPVGLGNPPMMFPVNSQCYPAGSEVESEERSSSRLDSLPTTLDSFSRLESLNFRQTPDSQLSESRASRRSLSPTAPSQVTDSQVTDIGPSDSISVRGYKGEPSLEWALRDAGIHGPVGNSGTLDTDRDRMKIRSEEKHQEPESAPVPPVRPKRRNASHLSPEEAYSRTKKKAELRSPSKESLSQADSGSQVSNDLMYAIRKFERSVNNVPSVDIDNTVNEEKSVSNSLSVSKDSKTPQSTPLTLPVRKSDLKGEDKDDQKIQPPSRRKRTLARSGDSEADGRISRTSTTSFLSLQPSNDDLPPIDTDSTDIPILASDFATGDESDSTLGGGYKSPLVEEEIATAGGYKWIIQQPGETPQLVGLPNKGDGAREDERRNAWRAEVSLWRARLVVSLCRGRGLDRQDWATFHLLVRHPLSLDLKLSLLHAPRLCAANVKQGAPMVRIALLHLAQYGEMLLQTESSRQNDWKTIKVDASLPWVPVKGSTEILHVLGYRAREEGFLRFSRRKAPETSLIARLTLDMLVLAEELRLYITGGHQCPNNVSDLFPPAESQSSTPVSMNVNEMNVNVPDIKNDSSKSEGNRPVSPPSISFVSAHSTPSHTDEETETLHASVCLNHKEKIKELGRYSSSEEEKTLRAHLDNQAKKDVPKDESPSKESTPEPETAEMNLPLDATEPETSATTQVPPELPTHPSPAPSSLDEKSQITNTSSLPDLQSLSSTGTSKQDDSSTSQRCSSATPTAPVASKSKSGSQKENSKDNPDDHIYEEIGDVKAQVVALRQASASTSSLPPPLPPKARASSGVEDDSGLSLTYPKMDWSIASQDGSLRGGSTGIRKKKRRAPMPPSFMPPDWAENNEDKENINNFHKSMSEKDVSQKSDLGEQKAAEPKKFKSQQSLNPFYEDSLTEKEANKDSANLSSHVEERPPRKKKSLNPFYEDRILPSGYVGKNPFYEDVETVKKTILSDSSTADSIVQSVATGSHTKALKPYDNIPVVRPKRKAPRPPPSPVLEPDSDSSKKSKGDITPSENKELLSQTTSTSEEMMLDSSTKDSSNKDKDGSLGVQTKVSSLPGVNTISGSTADVQARGNINGTATVPSSRQGEQPSSETITVSGVETVPISAAGTMSNLESENVSSDSDKIKSSTEGTSEGAVKGTSEVMPNIETQVSTSTATSDEKTSTTISKIPTPSTVTSSSVLTKQGTAPSTTETTSGPASPMVKQALPGGNTSISGTQPTAVGETSKTSDMSTPKRETAEAGGAPRPITLPEKSLSLADDIPYIDNSDVAYYKSKRMAMKTNTQRAPLFLHEKTGLPFIDDVDLPPNRPPPPPPTSSPPHSPPPSPPPTPPPSPPPSPPPATNQPSFISESANVITMGPAIYANTTNNPVVPISPTTSITSTPSTASVTAVSSTATNSFVTTAVSSPSTSTSKDASPQSSSSTRDESSIHVDAPVKEDVPLLSVTPATTTSASSVVSTTDATPVSTSTASGSSMPTTSQETKLKQPVTESQYEIPEAPSAPVSIESKKIVPPPRTLNLKPRELSPEAEERYEIPEAPRTPQDPRSLAVAAEPPFTRLSPIKEASSYSQASESDRYEIPEKLTNPSGTTRISRLEPPRASTHSRPIEGRKGVPSRMLDDKGSGDLSQVSSRSADSSLPPRPPRRRRSLRPPPRPPKAPLKGSGELASTLSPITGQERSYNSSVSLSSYSTLTRQSSSASSTLAQSPIPSEPSTPIGSYPVHSEVVADDSKKKDTLKNRLRKSWPLLLCECMYANCHPFESTENDTSVSNKKSG